MPPQGHKPIWSDAAGPSAAAHAGEAKARRSAPNRRVHSEREAALVGSPGGGVILEVAAPAESTVLPYYRKPKPRHRRGAEAVDLESFGPEAAEAPRLRDAAEGSFGETMVLEAIIGNDDRVRAPDPFMRTNPWRQICALRIKAGTGGLFVGTGWFIGPRLLATAGHCVFMREEGGWAKSIEVIPGKFGSAEPFGKRTATIFATVDGWINEGSRDFDYGVILLGDGTLGGTVGNFEVQAASNAELIGATARISGYPADRDRAEFQYYHERTLRDISSSRIMYDIDTFGGQSGSPIWRQENGTAVAVGIHTTGGVTSNSGTRISEPVLDNLIAWTGRR
jgi:glutamyl endopeptidase